MQFSIGWPPVVWGVTLGNSGAFLQTLPSDLVVVEQVRVPHLTHHFITAYLQILSRVVDFDLDVAPLVALACFQRVLGLE